MLLNIFLYNKISFRGRVDDLSFFEYLRRFCFCQLNFIVFFPFLIKCCHIIIIILFLLGSDRLSDIFLSCPLYFFPYSLFPSYRLRLSLVLFQSCCSHALVFGKRSCLSSYSHTECYFIFSLIGARETKHAQRTLLFLNNRGRRIYCSLSALFLKWPFKQFNYKLN